MTKTRDLTTAEAAERLGYSTRTIQRMADDGRLTPAKKLPGETGGYLFDSAEIERVAQELAEMKERELAELRGDRSVILQAAQGYAPETTS